MEEESVMGNLKLCKNCKSNNEPTFHGYFGWLKDDCCECPMCKAILVDINISKDDYKIIDSVSDDTGFLEAMIDLKEKDIVEYQLKMSQFKAQLNQIKQQEDNKPKCPHCKSTNISPIKTSERVGSIVLWGIFSKKINKSFKCNDCGMTW